MPKYNLNGKTYNIPDNLTQKFESENPNATVSYTAGGKQYNIPISKRDKFLKDFPDASTGEQTNNKKESTAQVQQKPQEPYQPSWQDQMAFGMSMRSAESTASDAKDAQTIKNIDTYREQQPLGGGVAKTAPTLNLETGQLESNYVTSAGSEHQDKREAEDMQRRLNDAYWRDSHPLDAAEREVQQDLRDLRMEEERNTQRRREAEGGEPQGWWETFKRNLGASLVSGIAPMGSNVNRDQVEEAMVRGGAYGAERQAIAQERDVIAARRRIAEETQQLLTDLRKDQQMKWGIVRAGEKVLETALDPHTWDFGEADLSTQLAVADAVVKADSGIGISANEQKLLDTWAKNAAINSQFSNQLSGWTKAGMVTGESLPFMLEMAMNPAAGLGEAATSQLVKYSLKKYGTKWVKDHAKSMLAKKIATRLVGDVVGSGLMASTTGMARVAADAERRMTGDVNVMLDANGDVVYDGIIQDTKENPGAAIFKAMAATSIENWSEMAGNYLGFINSFFGKALGKSVIGKAGRKMLSETGSIEGVSLNKAQQFIYELAAGKGIGAFSKGLQQFANRTQWHGVVGEYLEEVIGNIANAAIVGDMTFDTAEGTGVFNLQQNIDTFCGVALMGGFMSTLNTVGYAAHRYNYDLDRVSNANSKLFGDDMWNRIKTVIDSSIADPRALNDALTDFVRGDGGVIDADGKKAILKYTQAALEQEGAEMANYQPRMASSSREEVSGENGKQYVVTSFDKNGDEIGQQAFATEDEAIAYEGELKMQQQRQDYKDYLSMTNKLNYSEASAVVDEFLEVNGFDRSNGSDDAFADFLAAVNDPKSEVGKQFLQFKQEKIIQKAQANRDAIAAFEESNGWSAGTVQWLSEQDPMQLDAEGLAMADQARTFLEGLAYPANEVHVEHEQQVGAEAAQAVVENVISNEEPIDPQSNAGQQIHEQYTNATNALNELFARNEDLAQEYQRLSDMGLSPQEVISSLDSFRPEDVQTVIDYYNAEARQASFMAEASHQIDNVARRNRERRTFSGTIDGVGGLDTIVGITDGTNNYTLVSGNVTTDSSGRVTGSDSGLIIGVDDNGNFVNLGDKNVSVVPGAMTLDQYEELERERLQEQVSLVIDPNGAVMAEEEQAGVVDRFDRSNRSDNGKDGVHQAVVEEQSDSETPVEEPAVTIESVVDKDGVKRYENGVDIDAAIADIQADGLDVNETADLAIAEAQEELDKIKAPKTRAEQVKSAKRRADLQGTIDYYTELKDRFNRSDIDSEESLNDGGVAADIEENIVPSQFSGTVEEQKQARIQALKAAYGELFDDDFTKANDVFELVSMWVGRKRNLAWDDVNGKRGLQKELGWTRKIGGDTRFIETLLTKKGEGMGVDEFVHAVWESPENDVDGEKRFDTQEIKDALLDLLKSATSKSDVVDYAVNTREAQARAALEEQRRRTEETAAVEEETVDVEPMTDEQIAEMEANLPFVQSTDEDIPDAPVTLLMKEVEALNQIEGMPEIRLLDTDRMSDDEWYDIASGLYGGAFVSQEEIDNVRNNALEIGVVYNENTGEIVVFSDGQTAEDVRNKINYLYEEITRSDTVQEEGRDDGRDAVVAGVEQETTQGEVEPDAAADAAGEGRAERTEPERPADDYLTPRNDEERQIIADVERKLNEEIADAEDAVRKAKSALEKAQAKESDRATDMFSDDEAFETEDQLFSFDEMGGTDRSQEGVERRTSAERAALQDAENTLERLQSQAEHDSRVRGALDEARRQTSFDADPMAAIERNADAFRSEQEAINTQKNPIFSGRETELDRNIVLEHDPVWYYLAKKMMDLGIDTSRKLQKARWEMPEKELGRDVDYSFEREFGSFENFVKWSKENWDEINNNINTWGKRILDSNLPYEEKMSYMRNPIDYIENLRANYEIEHAGEITQDDLFAPSRYLESGYSEDLSDNEEKLNKGSEDAESEKKDVSLQSEENRENESREMESPYREGDGINGKDEGASDVIRGISIAAGETGQGSRSKERLLAKLEESARDSGYWIDEDVSSIEELKINVGGENEVYFSQDGVNVVKLNNLNFLSDDATNFDDFLNRLDSHNELFPDVTLQVIGFAKNSKGETCIVLRQPLVKAAREATEEEIDAALEDMDFYTDIRGNWTDGRYEIADLKPNNVLVDEDGNLHFIDVVTYDSQLPGKMMKAKKPDEGYSEDVSASEETPAAEQQPSEYKQRLRKRIDELTERLGTSDRTTVVESLDDIADDERRAYIEKAHREGRKVYGWFDSKTGKVSLFLPDIDSEYKAEQTIWHETVAHVGLRELLGAEKYGKLLNRLWMEHQDKEMGRWVTERMTQNGWSLHKAIDEWLAREAEKVVAERQERRTLWQKLAGWVGDLLREIGYRTRPTLTDVRYLFWLSENQLREGEPMSAIKRAAFLHKLEQELSNTDIRTEQKSDSNLDSGYSEDVDGRNPAKYSVKDVYHKLIDNVAFVNTEAFQDSLMSIKKIQDAMVKMGSVLDSQNAYQAFNLSYGKIKVEADWFKEKLYDPIVETGNKIKELTGMSWKDLGRYVYVKHGLERNREFYVRDWLEKERKKEGADLDRLNDIETRWYEEDNKLFDDLKAGNISFADYLNGLTDFIKNNVDNNYDPSKHDYSGFRSMFGDENGVFDEAEIIDELMNTDGQIESKNVDELWERINAANEYMLERYREAGMRSDEEIDNVKKMFHWYVPLRGFKEDTGEDVYQYFSSKGNPNDFVGHHLLKKAKGRESEAKNPLSTMFTMGYQTIVDVNRNYVKQKFYRLCQAHPNDLVVMSDSWAKYDEESQEWVENYPKIPEDSSEEQIRQITQKFEEDMQRLAEEGKAKKITGKAKFDYRPANKSNEREHIVEVMINGQKKRMTIIGNPRAAQAINGKLNYSSGDGVLARKKLTRKIQNLNKRILRMRQALSTNYSLKFIVKNAKRDFTHLSAILLTKESVGYVGAAEKYYFQSLGGKNGMRQLFKRYREGKLDLNNEIESDFKDFMDSGGLTGFVQMNNVDEVEKEIEKIQKQMDSNGFVKLGTSFWKCIPKLIESYNEAIENRARFATYRASRHYAGRTKERSAYDAKEVTANFNKHGAGKKTMGFISKNASVEDAAAIAGYASQILNENKMFFNATIQSEATILGDLVDNKWKLAGKYAGKLAVRYASIPFLLGSVGIPMLNMMLINLIGSDDDDDPYANLSEWDRRNNICIYVGKGFFIKIALGQELAAFYALGDMAAGMLYYNELRPIEKDWIDDMIGILNVFSPIDIDTKLANDKQEGAAKIFAQLGRVYSNLEPWSAVANNISWTGRPIYMEDTYPGDELTPEYKRAYRSTGKGYVKVSEFLNWASGGDDVRRGSLQLNPGQLEYLTEQYLSGPGRLVINTADAIGDGINFVSGKDQDFNIRKIEMVNAVLTQSDDRSKYYRTLAKLRKYEEEAKRLEHDLKGYDVDASANPYHYLELQKLLKDESLGVSRMVTLKRLKNELDIDNYRKAMNATEGQERKEWQRLYNERAKYIVDELDRIGAN